MRDYVLRLSLVMCKGGAMKQDEQISCRVYKQRGYLNKIWRFQSAWI